MSLADEPLYVKNLSPVSNLFGIPSQRSAASIEVGAFSVAGQLGVANHYILDASSSEALNLDGETLRTALEVRYGFADKWDLQLDIPWLDHSEGELNTLIDNWHDFWGMPDGGRPDVERGQLDYRYVSRGANVDLRDEVSGMGDATLAVNYAFFSDKFSVAALSLGYKFGSADEEKLLASGEDDIFLALRFSGQHLADLPLTWHGQLGYLRAGKVDFLGPFQERDLWFAGLALDWVLVEKFSLLAQIDAHAAPLDSELTALGDDAILLSLGARWRFSPKWAVDLNFVEDIRVETAPDITFQATIRYYGGH
ncbi:MAG: hypothetical protein ACJAUG_003022 [Halioglobus sp.]|jgi:hypothetical protein